MATIERLAPGDLLSDLAVVELADDLGEYGGKLLVDLGARVTKVVDPAATTDRSSARFEYLNQGKTIVEVALATPDGEDQLRGLLREADLLLENRPRYAAPDLAAINPRLVAASVTPFGLSGPKRDDRSSDLVALASGGLLYLIGDFSRPPARFAGRQAWDTAGAAAVAGGLLALRLRDQAGVVRSVEVSAQDTVVMSTENAIGFHTLMGQTRKRIGGQGFAGQTMTHQCQDGIVVGYLARRWESFLEWLDEEGIAHDDIQGGPWEDYEYRLQRNDIVEARLLDLLGRLTGEQVLDGAMRHRIIMWPLRSLSQVRKDPQLRYREFFVPFPGDPTLEQPGPPYRFRRVAAESSAISDQRSATSDQRSAISDRPDRSDPSALPLAGLKVVDLGTNIAVPLVGKFLALFGADVIKVESTKHIDSLRFTPFPRPPGSENDGNVNWLWQNTNAGKRSIVLDVKTDQGHDILLSLIKQADILMDNYGIDPMPKWGLTYDNLVEVNPRLIQLRSSVAGRGGPRGNVIGTGNAIASAAGLSGLTGFPGDRPSGTGTAHPDYTTSCHHALVAVLAAIRRRDRTGEGCEIDFSQIEGVAAFLGAEFLTAQRLGHDLEPIGNRLPGYAAHGVYPCQGDDRWCAIAARPGDDWAALVGCVREDDAGLADRLASAASVDVIDELIAVWSGPRDAFEIETRLQRAGVAAAAVQTAPDLLNHDGHLAERKLFETLPHGKLGTVTVVGTHIRLSGLETPIRSSPPLLGEQTEEILAELGHDDEQIAMLYVEDVLA